MAKQIAKREVGLGLNISEFAKKAKTAEELLDRITEGRTVALNAKLNLGDTQAVLQKILDQKTVSIRTAFDVKDLMGIMESAIDDFEQKGSTSLARMNRRFLEEFQTGLGSVNFKLDDGTLIGGYQQAIEQANKLNLVSEQQGKVADSVTTSTRKKTKAIQQETKATDGLVKTQKKVNSVNEIVSRISLNSSIKGVQNLEQEVAKVGKALSTMYDEGIRDTEEYITLQYKLLKLFDALADQAGGVRASGAKNASQLRSWIFNSIKDATGFDFARSSAFDAMFNNDTYAVFESSSKTKSMKSMAEELLLDDKIKPKENRFNIQQNIQQQEQLTTAVEETTQARQEDAQASIRTAEQINAELESERQKLREIDAEIERNDAALEAFHRKQQNYGKEVLGVDTQVYDVDLLQAASVALAEFNNLLGTRNKFQEKYIRLQEIISRYYVGENSYTIDQGLYTDLDQYISNNSSMRELDSLFQQGQKTTNKYINGLFSDVIRTLQSDGATVSRLLSSGDVSGARVGKELEEEEIRLNQTTQRLLEEREAQLSKINSLRQEELDLIKEQGKEVKASEQLKFPDGTILSEKEVQAVQKYCEILKKSMGEAYNEARILNDALNLVFNLKTGNVGEIFDRFSSSNKGSNAVLKLMTGMPVNNQENRNAALRSTNPTAYDQILAEQKAAAESAKAEMASQKTEFQIQWEEFASAMLGGNAFKDESNLVKGKILKAFSQYGTTAAEAIDTINKAWLNGDLEGKVGKGKYVQEYIDYLNEQKEYYDELRKAKAGDIDTDSLFSPEGTTTLTEEKAQALRDEAAAWDELIEKKKEYYGISGKKTSTTLSKENFVSPTGENVSQSTDNIETAAETQERIADASESTRESLLGQAAAAGELAGALEEAEAGMTDAEKIVKRSMEDALTQLRSAGDNKTSLIDLEDVSSSEDLLEQFSNFANEIARQANLKVESIFVSDDVATVRLYSDELKVAVTQTYAFKAATEDAEAALVLQRQTYKQNVKALNSDNFDVDGIRKRASASVEDIRASLHGLKYDLTELEDVAKNISSDEDFKKFQNLLKATQTEIAALSKSTVSSNSMNPFANMQRDMNNALETIEAMKSELATFGDMPGVEKAKKTLEDMTVAVEEFGKATDASGQKAAYSKYSELKSQWKTQIKGLNAEKPFAQMEKDMESAEAEIDTMKSKLIALLETFGHVDGIDTARKTLDDMTAAIEEFNNAQEKSDKKAAYDRYSDLSKQFEEQLKAANEAAKAQQELNDAVYRNAFQNEYTANNGKSTEDVFTLGSMSDYYKQEEEKAQQFNDNLKSIYSQLVSTIKQINGLDIKINDLAIKDGGSGIYSTTIKSLQQQKSDLIAEFQNINQEINNTLNLPSNGNGIPAFLDTVRERAALTSEEIQKLVNLFDQSNNITFNFATKLLEQIQPVVDKISSLKQMIKDGVINGDSDFAKNILSIDSNIASKFNELKQNPNAFDATQLLAYVNGLSDYISKLDAAAKKEQEYFSNKKKYTQDTTMTSMADDAEKASEKVSTAQQKLTEAAKAFGQASESDVFITNFTKAADGISKLDFSVFDKGTDSLRTFRIEMGNVTDGMYITETSISKNLSNMKAAQSQIQSMANLISRLGMSGFDVSDNTGSSQISNLLSLYKQLSAELSKGDNADQTVITKLTKDSKLAAVEVEKLYKKHVQLKEAIERGDAIELGEIDTGGDVYKQLTENIKKYVNGIKGSDVKIGKFNESTGKLKFSFVDADNVLHEFTVDLDKLGKTAAAQQTGVTQLGSKWDQFKNGLSATAKQLVTATLGFNVFYKALAQLRQGYQYVKEIDVALTELKKVTDETDTAYKNFLSTASKTAGTIGSTVSDFTNATANFARLGYSMEEASDMAKTAIVYKNVADGLDTVEESTDSIISTMKAFGIESDDTMSIVDKFNEVGNRFAITSAGIGEALQRSASALHEAGNSIDESVALVTAANSVIQNPEQVGK